MLDIESNAIMFANQRTNPDFGNCAIFTNLIPYFKMVIYILMFLIGLELLDSMEFEFAYKVMDYYDFFFGRFIRMLGVVPHSCPNCQP